MLISAMVLHLKILNGLVAHVIARIITESMLVYQAMVLLSEEGSKGVRRKVRGEELA